jgi:hypothetical protein
VKRFAWRELQIATDNFSEKNFLGQGGFGKVYKGVLADKTKVAVKRLTNHGSPGEDAAFQREVQMISVAIHRNLLRLIGFCTTPTERILVYPFMQNLSVAYRLQGMSSLYRVCQWELLIAEYHECVCTHTDGLNRCRTWFLWLVCLSGWPPSAVLGFIFLLENSCVKTCFWVVMFMLRVKSV